MISLVAFYQRAGCHRGVLCTASSEEAHTGLHCVRGTGVLFCMCLYHVLYVLVPHLHGLLVPLCLQCNPKPMSPWSTFHDKPHSFMAQDTNQRLMFLLCSWSLSLDAHHHLTFWYLWHLVLTNCIMFQDHMIQDLISMILILTCEREFLYRKSVLELQTKEFVVCPRWIVVQRMSLPTFDK